MCLFVLWNWGPFIAVVTKFIRLHQRYWKALSKLKKIMQLSIGFRFAIRYGVQVIYVVYKFGWVGTELRLLKPDIYLAKSNRRGCTALNSDTESAQKFEPSGYIMNLSIWRSYVELRFRIRVSGYIFGRNKRIRFSSVSTRESKKQPLRTNP